MNYPVLPQHTIAAEQLPEDVQDLSLAEVAGFPHVVSQRAVLAHLHEDVKVILGVALEGQYSHQMSTVRQYPQDVHFLLILNELLLISLVGDDFDRVLPGRVFCGSLLDDPEAALAEDDIVEDVELLLLSF